MDNEIYNNLLECYNESGPFYISKTPEIKIDWFRIYESSYKAPIFSAFLNADIVDLKRLLESFSDKSKFPINSPYYTILTKLEEWNNMYIIADSYFGS